MDHFGGYTAQAAISSGIGGAKVQQNSYGNIASQPLRFADDTKVDLLKDFLATMARDLHEECIYLRVGDAASVDLSGSEKVRSI